MTDSSQPLSITDEQIGRLLGATLDRMLEGLQVVSFDFRYLYVNEAVAKQGKKSKEELLGKTMMECYPGIEQTPVFQAIKRSMDEDIYISMDNPFEFPDGSRGCFRLFIQRVPQGVLILSIDISSEKKAQDSLAKQVVALDQCLEEAVNREEKMIELKRQVSTLKNVIEAIQKMSHHVQSAHV